MKVNVFTKNPMKIEESFKMLAEGISTSMVANKIVFEWKKINSNEVYTAYECEFTYEHQNRILDDVVMSQFKAKLKQIDPTTSVKKA